MASSTRNMWVYLKKIWHFNASADGFPPVYTTFMSIKIPFSIEAFESLEERVRSLDVNIGFKDRVENGLAKLLEMIRLDMPIRHISIITKVTEVLRYLANNINIQRVSMEMLAKLTEKVSTTINLYSIRMNVDGFSALWRKVKEWDDNFTVTPTVSYYMTDWDSSTFSQLDIIG